MKRFLAYLLAGVLLSLPIIGVGQPTFYIANNNTISTPVDFNTFAETDVPTKVTKTSTIITLAAGDRDEDYYVTKDYSAGYFTNFTHWVDVNVTGLTSSATCLMIPWAIANADDDLKDIDDANGNAIIIEAIRETATTHWRAYLYNLDTGSLEYKAQSSSIAVNNTVYLSIIRSATTVTVQIYSTTALRIAGAAGDLGTLVGASMVSTAFQYVYGLSSYNDGTTNKDISATVSNLILFQGSNIINKLGAN